MIKGNLREALISIDEVLFRTEGGHYIYQFYLGKIEKPMKCPWRRDNKPSWGIIHKENVWVWNDFSTGEKGNPITFVQKMFNLTFKEAIDKICWDFGIGNKKVNTSPIKITWEKPDIEKHEVNISVIIQPFKEEHKKFWDIDENVCNKYGCFAVKRLAINNRNINIKTNEPVFAYYAEDIGKYKIYFPKRVKQNRFRGNVPGSYLWYLPTIKVDRLFIAKSNKDAIVLSTFGLNVICTQSEGFYCIEPNVKKINSLANEVIVTFGADPSAVEVCTKITKEFGWKYFNTPKEYVEKGIIDPYDYVKAYGREALENLLKLKGLI